MAVIALGAVLTACGPKPRTTSGPDSGAPSGSDFRCNPPQAKLVPADLGYALGTHNVLSLTESVLGDLDQDGSVECVTTSYVKMTGAQCTSATRIWAGDTEQRFKPIGDSGTGFCLKPRPEPEPERPVKSRTSDYGSGAYDDTAGYGDDPPNDFDQDAWEQDQYEQDLYCEGDCTDMDNDGRTWDDYDADGDGYYETP